MPIELHPRRHRRREVRLGRSRGGVELAPARGRRPAAAAGRRRIGGVAPRELLREPKVGEDDVPVGADEDVLRLEVAVDDAGCVQALDALDDLGGVEARAVAAQTAPAGELRREVTTRVKVLQKRLAK